MIEKELFSSLIRNSKEEALKITLKYGLTETIEIISNLSAQNYYLNLIKQLDSEFQKICTLRQRNYDRRTKFLKHISKKLINSDINHCFFKGAAYSINYYEQAYLRPYNDFDVLVDQKDLEKFYSFLDTEKFKHRNNYKYLNRLGYTRSALEVIDSNIGVPFDFHYRFVNKLFKKDCPLTDHALQHNSIKNGISISSIEVLIATTMYHCFKQTGFALKIINIIDIAKLLNHEYDKEILFGLLKKTENLSNFLKIKRLIENLYQNTVDTKDHKLITNVVHYEKTKKNINFSKNMMLTQILHMIDPEPYINYVGGDLKTNQHLELLRNKLNRAKKSRLIN